jgi:mannosyltransferase
LTTLREVRSHRRPPAPPDLALSVEDEGSGYVDEGLPRLLCLVALAVLAVGVVLRFWTRSDLWLDEALTVDIARLPLHQIPSALREDGSPPLYYFLLHFWMELFGQSDLGVRSLSGVFGVVSLPLTWLAGRRLGGRVVAWTATLLVATSPFAVRYSTENRMYMMIVVLTLVGYLVLDSALKRPTKPRLAAVALITGLLSLSHYWCLYLLAAVILMLAWMSRSGAPRFRAARACLISVLAGFVLLLPWAAILVFQLFHTGTPWSQPASFAAMVNAVSSFAGGGTSAGRALGLIFFGLMALGLFGLGRDARHIDLDLLTRPRSRGVAWVAGGTLVIAILAGLVLKSAFSERYTAVMFAAFVLLVALGLSTVVNRVLRLTILALAVVLGLAGSELNINTNRTQAAQLTARIEKVGSPGDLVVYCPDQLGPAAARLLRGSFRQITYPRGTGPQRVDWVNYAQVNEASHPAAFARKAVAMAGQHNIFLVWSPDYLTLTAKCTQLEADLAALRPHSKALILQQPGRYYEHASLVRYWSS